MLATVCFFLVKIDAPAFSAFVCSAPMKFFSENSDAIEQGLFGVTVSIHAPAIPIPPDIPAYVREFQHTCGKCETAFDLAYISSEKTPFGVYCGVHGHVETEKLAEMTLSLNRKPESDPPPSMVKVDQKLGGFPIGLRKFMSFFTQELHECNVRLVVAIMDTGKWKLPIKRRKNSQALADFTISNETVVLSKNHCKVELSFHKGIAGCTVEVEGRTQLALNESCFEDAANALWMRIETLFSHQP